MIPLTAVMTGAPDLKAFLGSKAVFSDFVAATGGPALSKLMGAGVALAILNAVIAMVLLCARQLYATGRDGIWPGRLNGALTALHPRFRSPWGATLAAGTVAAALCLIDLKLLLIVTGTGVAVIYAILCAALIVGRRTGVTAGRAAPGAVRAADRGAERHRPPGRALGRLAGSGGRAPGPPGRPGHGACGRALLPDGRAAKGGLRPARAGGPGAGRPLTPGPRRRPAPP